MDKKLRPYYFTIGMDEKLRLHSLTFLPSFFPPFFKNEKLPKNGQKVKAIALLFHHYLPFFKNEKSG